MIRSLLIVVALAAGCNDSFYFLRGTLNGDCDPPRTIATDSGMPSSETLRRSNCQPPGAVCCRRNAKSARTSCQYPEDCYIAPYQGLCVTPVDCSDTQTCVTSSLTCQCTFGGPTCVSATTGRILCCHTGEVCNMGMCGPPTGTSTDGGM